MLTPPLSCEYEFEFKTKNIFLVFIFALCVSILSDIFFKKNRNLSKMPNPFNLFFRFSRGSRYIVFSSLPSTIARRNSQSVSHGLLVLNRSQEKVLKITNSMVPSRTNQFRTSQGGCHCFQTGLVF